jgi:hypothetical protein
MKIAKFRIEPPGFYPQQTEAINWLRDFLDSNELEAVLSGYAGTGKTYIIDYFVKNVCNVTFCPTAPTHKAVRVLEKTINRKGKTLQSLHGLRPNTDLATFNITNPQFDPKAQDLIRDYRLIIIDEASMINKSVLELNRERSRLYNVKILYIGDDAQIPPVGEDTCPVFDSVKNKFKLTEIVRQEEGNPLLELFPYMRADIKKNGRTFLDHVFKERSHVIDDVGYTLLPVRKFADEILAEFNSKKMETNIDHIRLLCWTNKNVAGWNRVIRNSLFNMPKSVLIKDDILTAYTTIIDEFNAPIIINSEDYLINTIREYTNTFDIKTFAVNLVSVYDGRLTLTLQIVDHTDEVSFKKYKSVLSYLHDIARKSPANSRAKNWIKYYTVKNSMLSMINFNLNDGTMVKKDIDYAYAMTIHKSQGSTFENVAIDLKDILYHKHGEKLYDVKDVALRNKLIYVALTRSKNKVYLRL